LSVQPGLRGSNDLRVGRKMANFQLFFQSGRTKDLSAPMYRRSWTSLPTPFVSAQRLSERTVLSAYFADNLFMKIYGTCLSRCTYATLNPATTNAFLFKDNVYPVWAPKIILGKVYVQFQSFLNLALYGVERLLLEVPAVFRPMQELRHLITRRLVRCRSVLVVCENIQISYP